MPDPGDHRILIWAARLYSEKKTGRQGQSGPVRKETKETGDLQTDWKKTHCYL